MKAQSLGDPASKAPRLSGFAADHAEAPGPPLMALQTESGTRRAASSTSRSWGSSAPTTDTISFPASRSSGGISANSPDASERTSSTASTASAAVRSPSLSDRHGDGNGETVG